MFGEIHTEWQNERSVKRWNTRLLYLQLWYGETHDKVDESRTSHVHP